MADIVSKKKRSQMMAGIKGVNTKPELAIRKELFARGYRYRLHYKKLPGKPDLVFPKYRAVVFIHGCFWHRHDCHLFKWPSTRPEFWKDKINGNVERDKRQLEELLRTGWRVLIIWECALKGKKKIKPGKVAEEVEKFLKSEIVFLEIRSE